MKKRIVDVLLFMVFFVSVFTVNASASGLNTETEDNGYEYTKYEDKQYSLDYHNAGWGWFDMGANLSEAVNGLTNGLWGFSRILSVFTGGIIEQAYSLDFIKDFSETIGKNMQTLAGISESGISGNGLLYGFILLFVLIVGIYVLWTGLVKKQISSALSSVANFFLIFVLLVSFVLAAPTLMGGLADFSSEVNNGVLNAGARLVYPDTDFENTDSKKVIINNLWNIQIKQPWLILQFGTTAVDDERIDKFLTMEPNSKERKEVAKKEVEDFGNTNMASENVWSRLGNVLLIIIVNLIISIFVILLMGIMLLSQLFFMIYAMVLPFSMILSLLPNMGGKMLKSVVSLFNILLARTGICLIIMIAFCFSSIFYTLSSSSSFLFVSFLQILNFACVFFFMDKLLKLVLIDLGDFHSMQRVVSRNVRKVGNTGRNVSRNIGRGATMMFMHRNDRKKRKAAAPRVNASPYSSPPYVASAPPVRDSLSYSGDNSAFLPLKSETEASSNAERADGFTEKKRNSHNNSTGGGTRQQEVERIDNFNEPGSSGYSQLREHETGGSSDNRTNQSAGGKSKESGDAAVQKEPRGVNRLLLPENDMRTTSGKKGKGGESRGVNDKAYAASSNNRQSHKGSHASALNLNRAESLGYLDTSEVPNMEKSNRKEAANPPLSREGDLKENKTSKPEVQKEAKPISIEDYINAKEQPPVLQEREKSATKPPEKTVVPETSGNGGAFSTPQLSRKQKADVNVIHREKQPTERNRADKLQPPELREKPKKGGRS